IGIRDALRRRCLNEQVRVGRGSVEGRRTRWPCGQADKEEGEQNQRSRQTSMSHETPLSAISENSRSLSRKNSSSANTPCNFCANRYQRRLYGGEKSERRPANWLDGVLTGHSGLKMSQRKEAAVCSAPAA